MNSRSLKYSIFPALENLSSSNDDPLLFRPRVTALAGLQLTAWQMSFNLLFAANIKPVFLTEMRDIPLETEEFGF